MTTTRNSQVTVGFVGLGGIGRRMADLARQASRWSSATARPRTSDGSPLSVPAPSPPPRLTPSRAAGLVVTMLPNGAIVRDAMLGWGSPPPCGTARCWSR